MLVPFEHTNERMLVKLINTSTTYGNAGEPAVGVPYTAVFGSYFKKGTSITPMDATSQLASPGTGHNTAHTDLAWHEVHATEHPGVYTFDVPDAAWTALGKVLLSIVVADCLPFDVEYEVGVVNANIKQVNGNSEAASNIANAAQTMVYGLVDDSSFTPTATQFQTDSAGFSSVNNAYNGRSVYWISGSGVTDEGATVTGYDGTNKRFTVSTMTGAPPNNAEFIVV